jgi:predicted oxidoreductase
VRIFADPVRAAAETDLISFRFRHRVNELVVDETGAVVGVRGEVLEPTDAERGAASSRNPVDAFELSSQAVLIASGGMGGNVDMVRRHWPLDRLGPKVPESFVVGVPAHVDGRMLEIAQSTGASWINSDRMWHYTEGLINWNPIWPQHGIRVLPGPSSLLLDATGKRLPPFLYPGSDTLSTLKHICATGYDYSWFIADKTVIAREFSLSGSEQNPDITGKSIWLLLQRVFGSNGTGPVQDFMRHGQDFIVRNSLEELVEGMNQLVDQTGGVPVDSD